MRFVPMKKAEEGMVLSKSVFDSHGRTLIRDGQILSKVYIEKLKEYGLCGVYIKDELSEGIEIDNVISPELRVEGMRCIREQNIDACIDVSHKMVDELMGKSSICFDMMDIRAFDDHTYAHSVNVAVISAVIGLGFDLKREEINQLVTAALLHDLGKLSIPAEILNKPERLTPEEYEIMKSHSTLSYEEIKERWDLTAAVKQTVLFHHENVDGSGYPKGIDGSEQSLFTKIVHVADVYDALISKRPYKDPYSPFEATEYLMGGCGIMFDLEVVKMLLQYVPFYAKGSYVELSNGKEGVVYENSGVHNLRPVVRTKEMELIDLSERDNSKIGILPPRTEKLDVLSMDEASRKEMIRRVDKYHILVVDDMKTNLYMLNEMLKDIYRVTLVESGEEAIASIKEKRPDLVLLDIDMPGMDGIETAKVINKLTEHELPILFVTALHDKHTVMMCKQMHAAGYIIRPYKTTYVMSEIARILTGWSEEA